MNEKFTIVKVSGKIVEKADELRTFVKAFAGIRGKKMLIFSGNMMAQEIGNKLGIKTKLIDDRPVVDFSIARQQGECTGRHRGRHEFGHQRQAA